MDRRGFLGLLGSLPFLGFLKTTEEQRDIDDSIEALKEPEGISVWELQCKLNEETIQTFSTSTSPYIKVSWENGEMHTESISASEYFKELHYRYVNGFIRP